MSMTTLCERGCAERRRCVSMAADQGTCVRANLWLGGVGDEYSLPPRWWYLALVNSDNRGVKDAAAGIAPKLTLVTTLCGGGTCPTVYRTDRGTLVVQGYTVAADNVDIDLPAGEQLVEIPAALLEAAMKAGQ